MTRHDALNFHLTNRLPRRLASRAMGWFAAIEHPWIAAASIRALAFFAGDLHLHEARTSSFRSLRDCFTRQLVAGARPIDQTPGAIVSPSDGIVVSCGAIRETTLIQAKGHRYTLDELLVDPLLVERHRHGSYVTLRLTAAMYHRFHAPCAGRLDNVRLVPGDSWNVNPPTLERVDRVYCRNTRAIAPLAGLPDPVAVTLVAVGAVLVSSIRVTALAGLQLRPGINPVSIHLARGDEVGYFEHGSTIIVLAAPGLVLDDHVTEGARVRVGQRLWQTRAASA